MRSSMNQMNKGVSLLELQIAIATMLIVMMGFAGFLCAFVKQSDINASIGSLSKDIDSALSNIYTIPSESLVFALQREGFQREGISNTYIKKYRDASMFKWTAISFNSLLPTNRPSRPCVVKIKCEEESSGKVFSKEVCAVIR
jgi:hypothetical protein